jgi:catechol 2,3-dioxygenase-like lactoylglutathione lyase family enzyme
MEPYPPTEPQSKGCSTSTTPGTPAGALRPPPRIPRVSVRRIKPNILSERFDESRSFYTEVIGLEEAGGLDWILFFGTDQREVQLSVMKLDVKAHVHPDVSIEVDDVDAAYERATSAGAAIVYPLTDEDWGLRRFFVRDPNGAVINVTEHR